MSLRNYTLIRAYIPDISRNSYKNLSTKHIRQPFHDGAGAQTGQDVHWNVDGKIGSHQGEVKQKAYAHEHHANADPALAAEQKFLVFVPGMEIYNGSAVVQIGV